MGPGFTARHSAYRGSELNDTLYEIRQFTNIINSAFELAEENRACSRERSALNSSRQVLYNSLDKRTMY